VKTEEKELITACKKGERRAFVELYERHSGVMFAICLRYARNRADAEDILQEGFAKIFNKLDQYKFEGSFEGWMKRVIVSCALLFYRKKSNVMYVEHVQEDSPASVTYETAEDQMSHNELMEMVQRLPFGCRTVFNLYAIEGFTHKEVAQQLGISEGTSKSQLSDSRRLLKKMIAAASAVAKYGTNG